MSEPEVTPVTGEIAKREYPYKPGMSGNPSGLAKKDPDGDTNVPPLLLAMRYVSRCKPNARNDIGLKKHCRKLLDEQPAVFLKQLHQLETDFIKSKEPTAKDRNNVVADEKDQDLTELITSLIGGFDGHSPVQD